MPYAGVGYACVGHARWGMHGGMHGGIPHLGRVLELAAVRPAACLDAVVESAAEEAVQRPPITIRRTAADLIGVGEG